MSDCTSMYITYRGLDGKQL